MQPVTSSTSSPLPTKPSHYRPTQPQQFPLFDRGNSSGAFVEGCDEYEIYGGNKHSGKVANTRGPGRFGTGYGFLERENPGTFGYQRQFQQPDPINQQPIPGRPLDIPLPPLVQQIPVQRRPLPRNLGPPINPPEGIPGRYDHGPVRSVESHFKSTIANNPSQVVIPQLRGCRSFNVQW
ncbi:hypothetical protein Hdeb2414_s0015g00446601 [Helianthus debilis subsp. tardiflorus]